MDIIVFCDKNGKMLNDSKMEFRLIEVSTIDEDEINNIISHSINDGVKLIKVNVLDEREYNIIKDKAKSWDEFIEWRKSKKLYEMNKEKFENIEGT